MKKDICREKGITLIALVVTIVILLILASVSISMLTGENGIIKQSQEAKENTKIGEERELVELSATAAAGRDNFEEIKKENLKEELDINIGEGKYTLEGEWPFKVTYNDSGRSYIVNKYGKVESRDNSEQASNIKWIYEENEDGNIEIIGIDLSEYKDCYTYSLHPKFDYLSTGVLDVSLGIQTLEVPTKIEEKEVVSFELSSFGDFSLLAEVHIRGVKTINFADGIETVRSGGKHVDISDLENVKLPANLKNLDSIFAGSKLTNINLPNTVTGIESMGTCFESTTTVNFPQGKNDALEIPSSKWGAGKITINGVEYTT